MKIVLVGGGGHCASCIDVIGSAGLEIAGVLDPRQGAAPAGTVWLGDDRWMDTPEAAQSQFLVSVGQMRLDNARQQLFEALIRRGLALATVSSPAATLGRGAALGRGTIVMHKAVVNAGARVGDNCIVNTAAVIEHGCIVGDHCHVATGAILNGDVRVGSGVMIGSGAIVLQGISICSGAMVGAGAVVTSNIDQPGTWTGIPARRREAP